MIFAGLQASKQALGQPPFDGGVPAATFKPVVTAMRCRNLPFHQSTWSLTGGVLEDHVPCKGTPVRFHVNCWEGTNHFQTLSEPPSPLSRFELKNWCGDSV